MNRHPDNDEAIRRGQLCPYCMKDTVVVDSAVVYHGRSYGPIHYCEPCRAWVGCHKGTTTALGRLANAELREWKKATHAVFDPIWKNGQCGRGELYKWLATRMDLPIEHTHVGMFDVAQCRPAISLLEEWNVPA